MSYSIKAGQIWIKVDDDYNEIMRVVIVEVVDDFVVYRVRWPYYSAELRLNLDKFKEEFNIDW